MTEATTDRNPQVLLPFPGPEPDPRALDVFVYLRPESNGVAVESTILSVVKRCGEYRTALKLVYLANIPGSWIVDNHVVEHHYELRLFFAVHGGAAFIGDMRDQFEEYFETPFDEKRVIGAFEALRIWDWTPDKLFGLWVETSDVTRIAGQVVKRYRDFWIVNYDIPALLHKNNASTDIAVMVFRTWAGYQHFFNLSAEMRRALVDEGLLRRDMPTARAVHISRSPFEQLLDTRDYLIAADGTRPGLAASSFAGYLAGQGVSQLAIDGFVEHPICRFHAADGRHIRDSLMDACEGLSYPEAWKAIQKIDAQETIPGRSFRSL